VKAIVAFIPLLILRAKSCGLRWNGQANKTIFAGQRADFTK
jgi:hypothetical protein